MLSDNELPAAAKFVLPLKQTEGTPGESALFAVKVNGVPKPELNWFVILKTIFF